MNVAVVVPFRSANPARIRAYEHVTSTLTRKPPDADYCLFPVDDRSHDPFSRAASRNLGVLIAERADADVVVLCDADTIPEREPLHAAIECAFADGRLHMPYDRFRGLTENGTRDLLAGVPAAECEAELDWRGSVGGVWVIRPDAWWRAGGMDETCKGWGSEDVIFRICADTILGPTVCHSGLILHLWHPSESSPGRLDVEANADSAARYRAAEGDLQSICALIAERSEMVT